MLTAFHKANLTALAGYLATLPKDYEHFNMTVFHATEVFEEYGEVDYATSVEPLDIHYGERPKDPSNVCGTAACAIGHGPAAGIAVGPTDYTWDQYSRRVFGLSVYDGDVGHYLFGTDNPNCPHLAAERIRSVLN